MDDDHPRGLMCFADLRTKENRWNKEDLANVVTGTVRGTFGVQLSSWLMSTQAQHATYAAMKRGKSGFYKCVNSHLQPFHGSKSLSTKEAQNEVGALVTRLRNCGFPKTVNMAWLDQNLCCWIREFGRNDGNDGRKNDVLFFSKDQLSIFLPYRHTGVQLQVFIVDGWHKLTDFWAENYHKRKGSDCIKLNDSWSTHKSRRPRTLISFREEALRVARVTSPSIIF